MVFKSSLGQIILLKGSLMSERSYHFIESLESNSLAMSLTQNIFHRNLDMRATTGNLEVKFIKLGEFRFLALFPELFKYV